MMNTIKKIIHLTVSFCIIANLFPNYLSAQKLPEQYREDFSESFPIRKAQHLELKAYVDKLNEESINEALTSFNPDFFSLEDYESSLYPYRKKVSEYFGYPPPKSKNGEVSKFIKVGEDVHCTIYRVWVEVIEGVNAYGIYMVPKNLEGKAPLIVAQHGGGGNPEAICDLDTRINYHSFGHEAVKRGYLVWAPALTMSCGYCDDPDITETNRYFLDRQLKLESTSIIGIELQQIIESTKALIVHRPEIDAERVGMTGLSWGGFYTMFTAAIWPFIKVAVPSGNFKDYEASLQKAVAGDSKSIRVDKDLFKGMGFFQAVGLICPRPCMVQLGINDGLFDMEGARIEAERSRYYYQKLNIEDSFEFMEHPGGHEFELESIFRFFDKHL